MSKYSNAEAWLAKCQALIPNYEKANEEGAAIFGNMLKSKMAASISTIRNFYVFTILLVLATVFVINIMKCIKMNNYEQPSISISIT